MTLQRVWMPRVNIYLPCECMSVCGSAWRQQLLWGFICSMTRQPVIYEHLVLLFKHSLISRQTFPEARAGKKKKKEWPGPDQTSHCLSASHLTCEPKEATASWEQSIKAHVCVYTECSMSAGWTAESNSATLKWWISSAPSFPSILLIAPWVDGISLNTQKQKKKLQICWLEQICLRQESIWPALPFSNINFASIFKIRLLQTSERTEWAMCLLPFLKVTYEVAGKSLINFIKTNASLYKHNSSKQFRNVFKERRSLLPSAVSQPLWSGWISAKKPPILLHSELC